MKLLLAATAALMGATSLGAARPQTAPAPQTPTLRTPDVIFVPTPPEVVDAMLDIAEVKDGDVLYDLGSGDGRIPIAAVKRAKVKATGIDIDPERIAEAKANAQQQGVADRVTFRNADLFAEDFSDATVITLYLLESLNEKLKPKLLALKPGTRIVSHAFTMGDWEPEETREIDGRRIYFWRVPARD
ncbi:SAM-dependent methyltransferase [Sphingomonas baiyangensis]|uniref:Methyltransferase domain-containing protein n=1 Tax=Sphingomonas baiyangensis TaxID=2572576 RepID=A0A4U1L457_9SPHN|nr:class I SAM-dependent methyltransferase [Sphingomonas baiyangensis]TKD51284.1 methyltransferase domain-containing protein [Sphingomonas baiyangensis]